MNSVEWVSVFVFSPTFGIYTDILRAGYKLKKWIDKYIHDLKDLFFILSKMLMWLCLAM